MLIAHIPFGYLLTKVGLRRRLSRGESLAVLIGSIFPDFDMIRFYVIDHRQIHHHDYWTHKPMFWLALWGMLIILARLKSRQLRTWVHVFFLCVMSHFALDTAAGEIQWFWPVSSVTFPFVHVPATHANWYLSFVNHGIFKVELLICALAMAVALKSGGHKIRKDTRANTS